MRPLNYAMLKYFTVIKEADVEQVMDYLKEEYSGFRTFKKKSMIEALMTAEANGILQETRYELDSKGELKVYYSATDDGKKTIDKYIN